jgi:hypothetical protein
MTKYAKTAIITNLMILLVAWSSIEFRYAGTISMITNPKSYTSLMEVGLTIAKGTIAHAKINPLKYIRESL